MVCRAATGREAGRELARGDRRLSLGLRRGRGGRVVEDAAERERDRGEAGCDCSENQSLPSHGVSSIRVGGAVLGPSHRVAHASYGT